MIGHSSIAAIADFRELLITHLHAVLPECKDKPGIENHPQTI